MNTTRRSKIARLPKSIRDELNQRLVDGDPASEILNWLNQDWDVEEVLVKYFNCSPINGPNLTEWRQGGHQDWLREQQTLDFASRLVEKSGNLAEQSGHQRLPDHFANLLATEFIKLAQTMLDENQDTKQRWACLNEIQQQLSRLRRDDHRAVWASIEHERWSQQLKTAEAAAAKAAHKEERRQHVIRYRILRAGILNDEAKMYGDSDIDHDVAAMSLEEQHDLEFGLLGRKSDLFALRRDPDEHIFPWRRTVEQRTARTPNFAGNTTPEPTSSPATSDPSNPSDPSHTPDSSNPPPPASAPASAPRTPDTRPETPSADPIPLANDLQPEASLGRPAQYHPSPSFQPRSSRCHPSSLPLVPASSRLHPGESDQIKPSNRPPTPNSTIQQCTRDKET